MNALRASVAIAIALLVTSCSSRPAEKAAPPRNVSATLATVGWATGNSSVAVDATVVGRAETVLGSRLSATVARTEVNAGDMVRVGQVLLRLETRETEGALEGARAALASARAARAIAARNRERFEALAGKGAAAAVELDRARLEEGAAGAHEAAALAGLRRAETDLAQAIITAPFDAVVVDRFVQEGDLALPGKPLVRLASRTGRRAEAAISEEQAARLAVGQPLAVSLGAERVEGRVAELVAAADPATRRRTVRVDLPAWVTTAPGTFARLELPGGDREEKRLVVPASAVVRRGGLELVFAVDERNVASVRYVQAGEAGEAAAAVTAPGGAGSAAGAAAGVVEIRSGLTAGERVVASPPPELEAGMVVRS